MLKIYTYIYKYWLIAAGILSALCFVFVTQLLETSNTNFLYTSIVTGLLVFGLVSIQQTPSYKGFYLEKKVDLKLAKYCKDKPNTRNYWDLMVSEDGRTAQIDNMLVTSSAIYVFELKNYKGRIHGSTDDYKWTQTIKYENKKRGKNGKTYTKVHVAKNQFYNPILQNKRHCEAVAGILNPELPVHNVVVFNNKTNLKKLNHKNESTYVIKRKALPKLINELETKFSSLISEDRIKEIDAQIIALNITDKTARKVHVNNIKSFKERA